MASPMDLDPPAASGHAQAAPQPGSTADAESVTARDDDGWDWDRQVSSVTSSVFDYEYENGRRYHGYKAGVYPMPNDEKELDRLDLQHHVWTLALNGKLYLAPLNRPRRVLDIGTGTGLWAILMADKHPEANVLGTDLSPVQPDLVPENAHFEIDDVESAWLYEPNYFDFIHERLMIGSVCKWPRLIGHCYKHLRPGGWLELQELDPRVLSDDGTHQLSPHNTRFSTEIIRASELYGKPVPSWTELLAMLDAAGFVDAEIRLFKIPFNTWPRDARLKEIGKYQLINYYEGYEGIGMALFTRALEWNEKEYQVFLAQIRNELRDRSIHTYSTYGVIYARKPLEPTIPHPRKTSPSTPASGAARSEINGPPKRVLPPVPLFHESMANNAPQQPSAPPGPTASVSVQAPGDVHEPAARHGDSAPHYEYPGKLTFRINRRGEIIRVRDGEDPEASASDSNTVYQFTVQTGQLDKDETMSNGSSSRKSGKDGSPDPQALLDQQEKLQKLRQLNEAEARDPEFQPGIKLSGDPSAVGMLPGGGLSFTKETYAKILSK